MKHQLLRIILLLLAGSQAWVAKAQITLAQETFEEISTDYGYTANPFYTAAQASPFVALSYFQRQQLSATGRAYPGTTQPLTNQQGSFAWTAENVRGDGVATRPPGYVQLNDIAATNYKNLRLTVAFGAPRGGAFSGAGANQVYPRDRIRLQYSFDGGPWITAGLLMGNNALTPGTAGNGGDFQQLINLSDSISVANGNAPAGNGIVLDQMFRDISANITGTGTTLRVRVLCDFYFVELAFDNIRVTGEVDNTPKPTLSALESTAANYTEGGSSTPLTSSLQVGYSDNSTTTITGASVSISSNFISTDRLNFNNQNGITGSYNTGTGVLTLSGTATQAVYQAAMRSITYSNTNATTLPSASRQVTFQVYTGNTALSNTPVRTINVTAVLNGPASLPYTETFDTDGDGTRYDGDVFIRTASLTGFFRTTTSPATYNGTTIGEGTFTGYSGGYWFGEGNAESSSDPAQAVSILQMAPVNAGGRSHIKFTIALGSAGRWLGYYDANNPGDQFELFYRINTNTPVKFGAFYGVDGVNPARQDTDLDLMTPATGIQLTPALQDFTFELPSAAAVDNLTFLLRQRARGQSEIAFDNIRITGLLAPTVTTNSLATNVSTSSAGVGGTLLADGGASLTHYGVVYVAGTDIPTTANSVVEVGTSSPASFPAAFSASLTGLTAGSQYTARAYAINSAGTSYGSPLSFTTLSPAIVVAPATLLNGSVGVAYTQTLTASGGSAPYSYAITAGALPGGLTLSSAGTLSGTPLVGGTCTFTVRAVDASTGTGPYSGSRSYAVTIEGLTITGLSSSPAAVCTGSPVTLTATIGNVSGSYNYTLTNGAGTSITASSSNTAFSQSLVASGSGPQSFTLTVSNGTQSTWATTSLRVNELPVAGLTNNGPLTCAQTSVMLTASGGGSYRFSNGASQLNGGNTASVNTAGPYSVTVTSANGCTATAATMVVSDQSPPTAGLIDDGPLSCLKTSVTLTAGGGGTYRFSNGASQIGSTNQATVNLAGPYSVTVTGANGCTATASTTVMGDQTPPTAGLTNDGPLTCLKTSVTLIAAPGGSAYRFSNGATQSNGGNTASVTTAGPYSVTVTSANGCTAMATTTVMGDQTPPTASLTNDGPLNCTKTSVRLTAGGGSAYRFSNGATQSNGGNTASITTAGPYSVTVTSANGCTATASTTVGENKTPPTASLSNNDPLSSTMGSVTLTAAPGGVAYAFSAGASQQGGSSGNTATVTTPGTYSVIITGANGCTATASTSVTTTATPTGPQTICRNSPLVLTTARPAARYEWYKNGQTAANKLIDVASIQVGTTTASLTLVSLQTSATYYVKEIQASGSFTWRGPFSITVDARCTARIGLEEPLLTLRVLVTPNPLEGAMLQATVEGPQGGPLTVQLVDLQGRTLYRQHWQEAEQKQAVSWSVSSQPAGVYLLQASTTTQRQIIKVVKP